MHHAYEYQNLLVEKLDSISFREKIQLVGISLL